MDKKIKKLWLKALRSGKYKQAMHTLKNNNNEYCCLGVLCDIYAKINKKKGFDKHNYFLDENAILPMKVIKWAGLSTEGYKYDCQNVRIGDNSLSNLNDKGKSFKYIANVIDKKL